MEMEKNIRLSKNQARNARRRANKELEKKQKSMEHLSSYSSEGKVMVGQANESTSLLIEMEKMKKLISKYEEKYNQGERIRELMNNIEYQNNELLILRQQLIQSNIVTEQQLYTQSQNNFKQGVNMSIEVLPSQAKDQEINIEQNVDKSLIKRIEQIEKLVLSQLNKKNRQKIVDVVVRNITYQKVVKNDKT